MTLRQRDFVIAARLAGSSQIRLLTREILPNMLSLVVANFMFSILFGILSEAGLQFLGLGNVNAVSWGSIIYWAENGSALLLHMWWWFIPPGAAIALVGIALALVNSGIDQISNPRLRSTARKGGRNQ
jgi:peptide/nickel transport system permease protein